MRRHTSRLACVALLGSLAIGCGGGDTGGKSSSAVDLTGAGATFPYPIYSRWFSDYAAKTGVRINYQSIGSGGGIRQLVERTVDFGASEAPVSDEELAKAKGGAVLQLPLVAGAVAIVYHLPGIGSPLRLSGELVADIFLGKVTRWNDARIVALNAGTPMPNQPILVVYRADPSGTTFVLSDYLARVSPAWKAGPGTAKELRWPVGLGAKGNEGVAGQVKQTPFAIGFVELAYAEQNRLSLSALRNRSGAFVVPSVPAIAAAIANVEGRLPGGDDFRVSVVDGDDAAAYPICSFTWILLYREQADATKGKKLVDFIRWALVSGRADAEALAYAPLPSPLAARVEKTLDRLTFGVAPR
jgi:phosphate transport system substrate-binding protein